MILAPSIDNELERLDAVKALKLLDTPREDRFDRLVRLAKRIFDVPIAYLALVDSERQWFKSACGLNVSETGRDISFCGHTIAQTEPLIVPDASLDDRFSDNPMVLGEPFVRFYAGHPLRGPGGQNVGTLCIVDSIPRNLDAEQMQLLGDLAGAAEHELQMVDVIETQQDLLEARQQLDQVQIRMQRELEEAADYVHNQLPARLSNGHFNIDWSFRASSHLGGDLFGYFPIDSDHWAIYLLDVAGHGVGSSLLAVTVHNELSQMTLESANFHDPASVLTSLNRSFPMERYQNKFFTVWFGVYNVKPRQLTYSVGGHHPALLVGSSNKPAAELGEPSFMIGVSENATFENQVVQIENQNRLYVFSDGVFEVRSPDNQMFGYDSLREHISTIGQRSENRVESVREKIGNWRGSDQLDDDFSLVEISFK